MPYIPVKLRRCAIACPLTAGELNYALTVVCMEYLERKGMSYQAVNEIIGAMECAKMEFYRRVAAPDENRKCKDNGDVFVLKLD